MCATNLPFGKLSDSCGINRHSSVFLVQFSERYKEKTVGRLINVRTYHINTTFG